MSRPNETKCPEPPPWCSSPPALPIETKRPEPDAPVIFLRLGHCDRRSDSPPPAPHHARSLLDVLHSELGTIPPFLARVCGLCHSPHRRVLRPPPWPRAPCSRCPSAHVDDTHGLLVCHWTSPASS